jgi:hypothetical protein
MRPEGRESVSVACCPLTKSLSGCHTAFGWRRERTIVPRSRRTLITLHGRSKGWLAPTT